jgi:hypothetical protein
MSNETTAFWSAIAAMGSMVAAFIMLRIQHKAMLVSDKPELLLSGWKRENKKLGDSEIDILTFTNIQNAGKGSAFHVYINASKTVDDIPIYIMPTKRVPIVPINSEYQIAGEISLFWNNVQPIKGTRKNIHIRITILSWCSNGHRHETIYNLMVEKDKKAKTPYSAEVVDDMKITNRYTVSYPVWKLKFYKKLSKVPFIGKYISTETESSTKRKLMK